MLEGLETGVMVIRTECSVDHYEEFDGTCVIGPSGMTCTRLLGMKLYTVLTTGQVLYTFHDASQSNSIADARFTFVCVELDDGSWLRSQLSLSKVRCKPGSWVNPESSGES